MFTEKQLDNICPEHKDFSIGISDLQIVVETKNKQKVKIQKNGISVQKEKIKF